MTPEEIRAVIIGHIASSYSTSVIAATDIV